MTEQITEALFWAKVDRGGTCWLWTASRDRWGYGKFWHGPTGRTVVAHRFAYESARGPIESGMQLDHLCKVRRCVNPDHLEPVSARENILRSTNPAAANARKTRCKQGHEYSTENTYIYPDGRRECRTCHADRLRARRRAA